MNVRMQLNKTVVMPRAGSALIGARPSKGRMSAELNKRQTWGEGIDRFCVSGRKARGTLGKETHWGEVVQGFEWGHVLPGEEELDKGHSRCFDGDCRTLTDPERFNGGVTG